MRSKKRASFPANGRKPLSLYKSPCPQNAPGARRSDFSLFGYRVAEKSYPEHLRILWITHPQGLSTDLSPQSTELSTDVSLRKARKGGNGV